ncbi:hypothetical protein J6590_026202 [Homalodisca vitripennis]|nr:hypothetical protein J6590_026202 [Homalodisca vitripennis]
MVAVVSRRHITVRVISEAFNGDTVRQWWGCYRTAILVVTVVRYMSHPGPTSRDCNQSMPVPVDIRGAEVARASFIRESLSK